MSKKDNYQNLASQFVDLWQEQVTTMMNDPECIRLLLQMMQIPPFAGKEGFPYGQYNPSSTGAAAAPDARDAALARIERRIGAIEERIAGLEAARSAGKKRGPAKRMAGGGGKPRSRTRSRPGSAKKGK